MKPAQDDAVKRRLLREFLIAHRAALSPAAVGLPPGRRRRTPGLRREEVATLAGVGVTWYTWLEQGRDIGVSRETLQRIASALRLTASDTAYILSLASARRPDPPLDETPLEGHVQDVLDAFGGGPALVFGPYLDVKAFNRLANYVFSFEECSGPFANNHIWRLFMDPKRRALYVDWDLMARITVGVLRASYPKLIGESRFDGLIQALESDGDFKRLWTAQITEAVAPVLPINMYLPEFGQVRFRSTRMKWVPPEDRLWVVFTPADAKTVRVVAEIERKTEPGSPSIATAIRARGQSA